MGDNIHRDKNYEEIFMELYLFTFLDAKESVLELENLRYRNFFFEFERLYKYGNQN